MILYTIEVINIFFDRIDAGHKLYDHVKNYINENTIIYAVPRGGIKVAEEICRESRLPMKTVISRKLRFPFTEEIAIGAVVEDGLYIVSEEAVAYSDITEDYINEELKHQVSKINNLRSRLRNDRDFEVFDKRVIVVDDGIATGMSMLAIVRYMLLNRANEILVAAPIASKEAVYILENNGARVVALEIPEHFEAVGSYYSRFNQVSIEEAADIIGKYN